MDQCPCGSELPYAQCCEPLINGIKQAETAEQLMRSRYCAFTRASVAYLIETVHPDKRSQHDEKTTRKWAEKAQWHSLNILATEKGGAQDTEGIVEFVAQYTEKQRRVKHHEIAQFKKQDGRWYFVDGEPPAITPHLRPGPKIGRNDPCPCGSGKKFKKCCGK
jgi:SEC-C motif-containing protein